MKKKIILPFVVLLSSLFVLGACGGNTSTQNIGASPENNSTQEDERDGNKDTKKEESEEKEYYPYQKLNGEYVTLSDGTVLSEGPYCSSVGMFIMNQKTPDGKIIERYDTTYSGVTFNNLTNNVDLLVSAYDPVNCSRDKDSLDLSQISTSSDILEQMAYKITDTFCYYEEIAKQEIVIDSTEPCSIQCGLDATRWEGTIKLDTTEYGSQDLKFVACGILGSDGRPYLIAGVLDPFDRSETDNTYLGEIVDGTVQTFGESPLPEGTALDDDSWSFKQFGVFEWQHYE